jgi:hypothetical protein
MSFFLAHVRAGTELYHGSGNNLTVTGMEWLAFEPEHAMNFARTIVHDPSPPKDVDPPSDHHDGAQQIITRDCDPSLTDLTAFRHQQLLGHHPPPPPPHRNHSFTMISGYLHTYAPSLPLTLLYLDGQSAAKSSLGTLDTQDYLLAPSASWDYARGHAMCALASTQWNGRIHGFIRMEHGFEVIMCNFSKSVDLQRIQRVGDWEELSGGSDANRGRFLFTFLQAVMARYGGIGGARVVLRNDEFVSVFAQEDVDLFGDGEGALPRLTNITSGQREGVMAKLTDLILKDRLEMPRVNYQAVADLLVTRYSSVLYTLAYGPALGKHELHHTLKLLLRPFIDYDARDLQMEVESCTLHFLPTVDDEAGEMSLGRTAIVQVSHQICSTLFTALSSSSPSSSSTTTSAIQIQSSIHNLTTHLAWTTWKECRPGCMFDEICLTAIWPIGDKRSHDRPYCVDWRTVGDASGRPGAGESYWDGGRR